MTVQDDDSKRTFPRRRKRFVRILAYLTAAAVLLASAATVVLRARFNGRALASVVETTLADKIRGSIKVGSIQWPLSDLGTIITGGWLELQVRDLVVMDEFGTKVIQTPGGTLEINVGQALRGVFHLRNVRLASGGYVHLKQVKEPYPAHEYDTHVISLISAFYPKKLPQFHTGYSAAKHGNIDIENFLVEGNGRDIRGITLDLDLGATRIVVTGVRGGGYLYYGGADPLGGKLYYSLASSLGPATGADTATITYTNDASEGDKPPRFQVNLHDLKVERLSQLPSKWPAELVPRDVRYKLTALGEDDMTVTLEGAMLDSWVDIFGGEVALSLDLRRAGSLIRKMSGGFAGGEAVSLLFQLSGPALAPKALTEIRELGVYIPMSARGPKLALQIKTAMLNLDTATESGSMSKVVATPQQGGGRIEVEADFGFAPLHFDVDIRIPEPVDLAAYLPAMVSRVTEGTALSGTLSASGNQEVQRLEELHLQLGQAKVSGLAYRRGNRIAAQKPGVSIHLPGLSLKQVHGSIDTDVNSISIEMDLALNAAKRYLRAFQVKPLVDQLHGHITIAGPLSSPTITSRALRARGLPYLDTLTANILYDAKHLTIAKAHSSALGGSLQGRGEINLGTTPSLRGIRIHAAHLDLSSLPILGPILSGQMDVDLRAAGSTRNPDLVATALLRNWTLAGEPYADTTIRAHSARSGQKGIEATIERQAGGKLHLSALLERAKRLAGSFSLSDVPLGSLLRPFSDRALMGGTLGTSLKLGGSLDAPTVQGSISLYRSWFEESFLGSASLELTPVGESQIRITGHLLGHRIDLDWLLTTRPPYDSDITLRVRRIELDRFIPALSQEQGTRAWVTGLIHFRGDLLGRHQPMVEAKLSEAEVVVAREDTGGRPSPIRFRNKTPLSLTFDGTVLQFSSDAIIEGPTGDFSIRGRATLEALDFDIKGVIALELLEPYFRTSFDTMQGEILAGVHLAGTALHPQLTGVIELGDISLKLAGQDSILTIPSGKIDVSNTQLSLTGLEVIVTDQFSDERSSLHISGGLQLKDFKPEYWAVRIDGQLAGKMLFAAAPEVFSAASGSAQIAVTLMGEGQTPDIDGTIEFSARDALSLTPRSARREIVLNAGMIRFTDQLIEFEGIRGTVDGEGQITKFEGVISLDQWKPIDVDISISTRDIVVRIPKTLELALHLKDFEVVGDGEQLEISGHIEVADGRYIQHFNPFIDALQPTRSTETETSIFESIPLLGNARLRLAVVSRAFFVDNNIAQIELNGEVEINGTPLAPRLDGVIHVVQGSFKFPVFRATFTRTQGSVTFSRALKFPFQTPIIDIQSESDYTSSDGQNHLVQLSLLGPLGQLKVDLGTSAGLNKQQTYQLLLSGRSSEDVRRSLLGDNAATNKPGEFSTQTTASTDNRLAVIDQATKDFGGDYLSSLIGDKLRAATGLDVARLELGTASIGFYGKKNLTRSSEFSGRFERSLSGWIIDLRTDYRLDDDLRLEGKFQQTNYDSEADNDKTEGKLSVTWRGYWIP